MKSNLSIVIEDTKNEEHSLRPSEAIDILKRPINKLLTIDKDKCSSDCIQKPYPNLSTYEKTKKRKRTEEKIDELIDEYEDLKEERKKLIIQQTKYYKEKN